jgi:23S rRNA-/tRNA-specific pseudouridylate synthase
LIAETAQWIAVNKPARWLSIPGRNPAGPPVLLDWMKEKFGEVWVVHRLDRETSGVILFARTADAHRQANQWFEHHEVRKKYDFLAGGTPSAPVFKIQKPIAGAPSTTQIEVSEKFGGFRNVFRGIASPRTGRRHQIRIHLSQEGLPILGDVEYGGARSFGAFAIDRVALHASELVLPTQERFTAPWPADFESWCAFFRKGGAE